MSLYWFIDIYLKSTIMSYRILWLLLVITSFTLNSYGQKDYKNGYVITLDNDTLYGTIDLKSNYKNSRSCYFQGDQDQVMKVYTPADIKAYRVENNKYYISKEITLNDKKKLVFLEFLVDGIVNLYYIRESSSEYYFIEKDTAMILLSNDEKKVIKESTLASGKDDKVYLTTTNQYMGILKFLFQDSPEAMKDIPNTRFDYKPLIRLTKEYHESVCKDYSCIDYTKSTGVSVYMEPTFGMIHSTMGLKTSDDHAQDLNPYYGLMVRLRNAKRLYRWNFLTGLNYSSVEFRGDFENSIYATPSQPVELHRIYLKYSYLSFPLAIEYSLPAKKLQPYFSASFNNIVILNSAYEVYKFDNTIPEQTHFLTWQLGFDGGMGLRYNLKNNSYFYMKADFEFRMPSANMRNVLDYYRVYSVMLGAGYGFRL
jgi:hypothetical protein